jgi:hypothetical protein
MDLEHGFLLGFLGCTVTFVGFFIAFLLINYNKRKELKKLRDIENRKKGPLSDHYFGDDTV